MRLDPAQGSTVKSDAVFEASTRRSADDQRDERPIRDLRDEYDNRD